ncbi:unnamed protein product [Pedinophyceae sp. YPF-701]|nr:unnamed protein product [Pedinophyceae sp. YPF-701]
MQARTIASQKAAAAQQSVAQARAAPLRAAVPARQASAVFTSSKAAVHARGVRQVAAQAAGNGMSKAEAVAAAGVEVTSRPMPLVFVSAEVAPWSKTGGLGDVLGGLPVEMAKRGHKVMTIAPRYDQYKDAWDTSVVIDVMGEPVRFFHTVDKGVDRVWVDHPWFLAKVWGKTGSKLYGKKAGADYADNQERFALFCRAAIEATRALPFGPGENCTFIANDWHSAMLPVLIKEVYKPAGSFTNAKVAFCIHNIAFQGRFWADSFDSLGLPGAAKNYFEFTDGNPKVYDEKSPAAPDEKPALGGQFAKVNWMQAGFLSADKLLTVSPNYATEVMSGPSKGVELDGVIRKAGGIEGIVNGMDVKEWNPAKDKYLDFKYDADTVVEGKAVAKATLQAEVGLPVDPDAPLFGFIGRLEEQKGVDVMLEAIPGIVKAGGQVVVLGTGKKTFEAAVKKLDAKVPGAAGVVKFSAPLAHVITAGADFMLVPSRFEPCGLIQLHAMQYGTVPVVASTGGLVDTVKEGVTGFHMGAIDPDDLLPEDVEAVVEACTRAIAAYKDGSYPEMSAKCISQDLSWAKPAKKWEAILEELTFATDSAVKKGEVRVPVAAL